MELVAEFTYNHLGDAARAIKMIDAAKTAGATCVKIELRNNKQYFRNYPAVAAQKEINELSDDKLAGFVNYCNQTGMGWFASVHNISSLKKMLSFNPRYIKIASREARIIPFLEAVREINNKRLPVIISTGALTFKEVEQICELMKDENLTLLHTSCLYPCNVENLNINRIVAMKERFNCNIGYSGHEQGIVPSLYAATLGISYLERHFTLEDYELSVAKGKEYFTDELCTLGPKAFKEMVDAIGIFNALKKQNVNNGVLDAELKRVNAYGFPSWDGSEVYVE